MCIDDFFRQFKQNIGDHFNIDCEDDPMKAIQFSQQMYDHKHVLREDDFVSVPDETNTEEETLAFCTNRLQNHLEEWVIQNLPRLFDGKAMPIKPNKELIETVEEAIQQTISDYVDFGVIKNHQIPTLRELHNLLEKNWQDCIKLAKDRAKLGASPSNP